MKKAMVCFLHNYTKDYKIQITGIFYLVQNNNLQCRCTPMLFITPSLVCTLFLLTDGGSDGNLLSRLFLCRHLINAFVINGTSLWLLSPLGDNNLIKKESAIRKIICTVRDKSSKLIYSTFRAERN